MSGSEPLRSAVPLAAAGIACLGLTPAFGGPEQPLHWAMTTGMVGFGALLWARHRLGKREGALEAITANSARGASRAVLLVTALCAAGVCLIILARWYAGGSIAFLSVLMPLGGLAWLAGLGWKIGRLPTAAIEPSALGERPSRRPPKRDSAKPLPHGQSDASANRHVSA